MSGRVKHEVSRAVGFKEVTTKPLRTKVPNENCQSSLLFFLLLGMERDFSAVGCQLLTGSLDGCGEPGDIRGFSFSDTTLIIKLECIVVEDCAAY